MRRLWALVILLTWVLGASLAQADPLTLKDCIDLALTRYPRIKVLKQRVLAAKAYEKAAFKDYFPSLGVQYRYTRLRDRRTVIFQDLPLVLPGMPSHFEVPISAHTMTSGEIVLTWPLFHGLSLRVQHQLAKLNVSLAQVEQERVRQELVYHVKEAYYRLLQAEHREKEAESSVKRLKAHLQEAQGFYAQGLIAKNDLLQSEVALAQAEHALVVAKNVVALARSQLNVLIQRPVTAKTTVVDQLKSTGPIPDFDASLTQALLKRPEIKAACLAIKRAQEKVRLAKSSLYPWVDLQAAYQKDAVDLLLQNNPYGDRENAYVGVQLRWQIWHWGQRFDQISAAKAQVLAQEAALRELKSQVALEVRQALLRLVAAKDRLRVAQKAVALAEENYRLNVARYQEQLATSTDVLDAEEMLTRARVDYVNALADYHLAEAYLAYTTGKKVP